MRARTRTKAESARATQRKISPNFATSPSILLQRETKLKRGIEGKLRNAAWNLSYLLALLKG